MPDPGGRPAAFDPAVFDPAVFDPAVFDPAVFDPAVFDRLAEELCGREPGVRIAGLYRQHLPVRVERLSRALDSWDTEALMDTALSLRAASATIGAVALQADAHALVSATEVLDLPGARAAVARVVADARATTVAMVAVLGDEPVAPRPR